MIGDRILHHFPGSDEVEHRHALRQGHQESREEAEKKMLADPGTIRDQKPHDRRDDETDYGNE